ncbi:acetoin utilization AcuB family protein [Carboxydothermus hydrogenoformans]|uniref:Acetoin utilization protein AcuB n=1 Tax=Carboxydothermus hydrogenoformans (strain ATCC BAA-161 / DSM 6008 / Z-2901) TaxID=246194 RepID=Q3AFN9_CARHZ|nr:acetoin utilization AcuB family protein [Carboxydothermus hydrogenoformans]ABB14761.1 acetoin utilization protein AcuB [Carboxydothermus hydrogenoformans Z-2901]
MLVKDIMTRELITVKSTDTIREAMAKGHEKRIRHLPVVDDGKLVGIVSDRDLRYACPSPFTGEKNGECWQIKVGDIMQKRVVTAHPLDPVEEAAKMMLENRVGCLPVLLDDELVGIITQGDIVMAFAELMGVYKRSSRIEVQVPDRPGMLAEVAQIMKELNINVVSVFLAPKTENGLKTLVMRVETMNTKPIIDRIRAKGFTLINPFGEV